MFLGEEFENSPQVVMESCIKYFSQDKEALVKWFQIEKRSKDSSNLPLEKLRNTFTTLLGYFLRLMELLESSIDVSSLEVIALDIAKLEGELESYLELSDRDLNIGDTLESRLNFKVGQIY